MKAKKTIKRVIDVLMLAVMLLLMAMQITKQEIHEWLGIGMFALVIAHHILNRKYYTSLFKTHRYSRADIHRSGYLC